MVYICEFEDLEPLAAEQVILSLQAYLYFVSRVILQGQWQSDVAKPNEMLLLNQFYGLSNVLCMENILQVV